MKVGEYSTKSTEFAMSTKRHFEKEQIILRTY